MDQLVVLQEIHESFFKGGDGLKKIDNCAIEGCCPKLVGKLLDGSRKGRIDERICRELSENLQDVYEVKRLGDICRRAGQPAIAADTYKRALSICDDSVLRPVLQNNLGQAHAIQGDLAKAEFYYKQAAEIFKTEGDQTGLAHVLGNLGSAYRQNGMWNSAIEHSYQSLKTFEEAGDDLGIAQMTGSIGRIYADMGENDLAARYFEKSLSDFQKLGDRKSAAWVLDRLGRIARERMDWDEALSYFQSSVSIFEEMGECSSLGVALSNLGRTFLQMNEPFAAREPLERSVLLVSRQARPDYQNALYSLARTYASLAEDSLQQAEAREENRDASGEQQRREASRLFALAADRYQDIASTLDEGNDEIQMKSLLAKSQAYLCQISNQASDARSLVLVDKAMKSLDSARANAKDDKKAMILELQRTLFAMKEIYSLGSLSEDEMPKSRAITNSTEYLLGAANGLESEEIAEFLYRALKSINAGIEAERSGKDPAERFQAAASELQSSKKYFAISGTEKARRSAELIEKAAAILRRSASKSGEEIQEDECEKSGRPAASGDERSAILAIAGALAAHLLERIEEDRETLEWDEDLRLSPAMQHIAKADLSVQGVSEEKIPEGDIVEEAGTEDFMSEVQNSEDMTSDEMIFEENIKAKELILADGCRGGIRIPAYETKDVDDGFLVTIKSDMASQGSGQLLFSGEDQEKPPVQERDAQKIDIGDQETDTESKKAPGCGDCSQEDHEQAFDAGVEDLGSLFNYAPSSSEFEEESPSSLVHPKVLFILKLLTLLVVLLLAIEAIIYLI